MVNPVKGAYTPDHPPRQLKPRMRQAIDASGRKGWSCWCHDVGVFGLSASEAYVNWKVLKQRRAALSSPEILRPAHLRSSHLRY